METLAGRYRLLEPLGSGGMSVVWRGYDDVLGRHVAVKVLAARFAGDAAFRTRIRREAQAVARFSDPHIANVYDYGEAPDGTPYVVMELVDGPSLADRLDEGPLPWPAAVRIGAEVAAALAAAHSRGVVHQDIKPANVMLSTTGAKVVDFGISAIVGERGGPVMGTPGYAAPEQRAGGVAAPSTDVYALGLVLRHSLDPRAPVPPALADLIDECLAQDPAARPPAAAVAARLAAVRATAPADPSLSGRAAARAPVAPGSLRPLPGRRAPSGPPPGGTRIMPPTPPSTPPAARVARRGRARRWPAILAAVVLVALAGLATKSLTDRYRAQSPAVASTPPASPRDAAPTSAVPPAGGAPSAGTVACQVDYQVSDYAIGFQARLKLTNTGSADVAGWTLAFDFPGNQKLSLGWGGVWRQDGKTITVRDIVVNRSVKPGQSVDIGFVGTYKGENDAPVRFTLNDVACAQNAG